MNYWHGNTLYIEAYHALYSVFLNRKNEYVIEGYFNGEWIKVHDSKLRNELIRIYEEEASR